MINDLVVSHCSPTLAGLKSGSMFTCKMSFDELKNELRRLNSVLVKKNIRIIVMQFGESSLVYMYRPDFLKTDFDCKTASEILCEYGYTPNCPDACVAQLCRKIKDAQSFPHEIGLFLGYPPEDVKGFIDNNAKCCKCRGLWKVYGDVEEAQHRFMLYKKCQKCYKASFAKHKSIDRLAVAVS